jgi:hypothetical protein
VKNSSLRIKSKPGKKRECSNLFPNSMREARSKIARSKEYNNNKSQHVQRVLLPPPDFSLFTGLENAAGLPAELTPPK